jgi:predicted TIM-barrel fold metal-dependent hydrolase
MKHFVFSADGHVMEPAELFTGGLPASLSGHGIHTKTDGDYIFTFAGEKLLHRLKRNPRPAPGTEVFGRPNQLGARDIAARLGDMELEGIDAEIVFPTTGMQIYMIENRDAEVASSVLYNDWIDRFLGGHLDRFVRCGVLPVRNFDDTVVEMERLARAGFTAAMLPTQMPAGLPNYNDPSWDKVFDAAQRTNMVMILHTAAGRADIRPERGPGAAVVNYTSQMCDAVTSLMYLVAGGVLDRFPRAQVAVIESGASWLAGLSERLDETYNGHHMFVQPKLSVPPSEVIKRQVSISFQYDRGCVMTRSITGTRGLMWGSDYPHHEGTFPNSRKVLEHLFDDIVISEQEKADIVGGNAARLFRLQRPEFANAA